MLFALVLVCPTVSYLNEEKTTQRGLTRENLNLAYKVSGIFFKKLVLPKKN